MTDLTAAESVMIDFLRGVAGDFHATIATSRGEWIFTATSPSGDFLVGRGSDFGQAFSEAMGAEVEPGGDPGDGEAAPAVRALRVVAGIDHHPERKVA